MSYLTDNPWPLILAFASVALVAILSGHSTGKVVALCSVLLAFAVYFVEQRLISPAEEVEEVISQMLDDFKSRNLNDIQQAISQDRPDLAKLAEQGLDLVTLQDSFHLKSVTVEFQNDTKAQAMIRANGGITVPKGGGGSGHYPTYWKTTWENQNGWKLVEVIRLNPANGTEMGALAPN